ncbi:hypothetical protein GS03_00001 [Flavobacterium sangjuense]|uniref:Uncharacterized protein n=1 Tax=Flavobacterium sangjuense TaxID=2518177 RepID=A0A4P7PPP5_9FLAO|nr:hypothetical protein GS03_00001 [Flavobacterium sangjuense]
MSINRSVTIWMRDVNRFSITNFRNFYSGNIAICGSVNIKTFFLLGFTIKARMNMIGAQFAKISGKLYWNVEW